MQKDEGPKTDRVTIQRPFLKGEHCSKKNSIPNYSGTPFVSIKNILWPKWTLIKPFNQK